MPPDKDIEFAIELQPGIALILYEPLPSMTKKVEIKVLLPIVNLTFRIPLAFDLFPSKSFRIMLVLIKSSGVFQRLR